MSGSEITQQHLTEAMEEFGRQWFEDTGRQGGVLTGYYVIGEYTDYEGRTTLISSAARPSEVASAPPEWTVRGWLSHALVNGLLGVRGE